MKWGHIDRAKPVFKNPVRLLVGSMFLRGSRSFQRGTVFCPLKDFCFDLSSLNVETDAKKMDWLKIWLLVKDPQFLSNQADIPATSPTHELVILTKFHKDWQENVDFSLIAKF